MVSLKQKSLDTNLSSAAILGWIPCVSSKKKMHQPATSMNVGPELKKTADILIFTLLLPFVKNLANSSMLLGFIGYLSLDKRQSSGIRSFISLIKAFHKQFSVYIKVK